MRMEYLRYLLEISRHRSISTAAQALYLSQTSLSTTVRRIEDELGFHIFSRTHSGVEITAEGEEALALITEILTRFDKIQRLGKLGSAATPAVLLLSPTISDALSIPLSQMFLERLPEGNLEFHIASGDEIGSQIINSKSNIGVTYYSADHLSEYCSIASKYLVEVSVLCRDQFYLLVRNSHPLAGRKQVSIGELNHLNFAILPHFNAQEDSIAYAKSLGTGNRYTTFSSVALLKQAVLQNDMASLLCGYAIHHGSGAYRDQLKAIPLVGTRSKNEIAICLLHRNKQSISHQENVLLECIQDYFKDLDCAGSPGPSHACEP